MRATGANPLKKAADLIRAGKPQKARPILAAFLRANPSNAQAWYLLSYAVDDPQRKQYALRQALRADPLFERAQKRLRTLRGEPEPAPVKPKPPAKTGPLPPLPPEPTPGLIFPSKPEPPAEESLRAESETPSSGFQIPRSFLALTGLIVLFAIIFFVSRSWFALLLTSGSPTATIVQAFRTLPPTWTPADTSEATPEAPAVDVFEEVLQLPPLDPAILAQMQNIQVQVSSLRGMESTTSFQNALLPVGQTPLLLTALYLDEEAALQLEKTERVLVALGLLPADYHLTDYELSRHADHLGGLYTPELKRIYVFGDDFSGTQPFAYAHEYGWALIDQNFDLAALRSPTPCLPLSDSCRALQAFVEGDATLLSQQWLNASAPAETFAAVEASDPPPLLVQTQAPLDFTSLDLRFLYEDGANFMQTVFDVGGWDQVDTAYDNPPSSSEQILHPEKYFAGERGQLLVDPSLADALGAGWLPLGDGVLGEWMTYLFLAQGSNVDARLTESAARGAAEGWGGDELQAYRRAEDQAITLVQHWVMDTDADASQLAQAMLTHLNLRFGGEQSELGDGTCWVASLQRTCLFRFGPQVLWLLAPDEAALINDVLELYPQFQ